MPHTKLTKEEEKAFQQWRMSLPRNLQADTPDYDLRGAWKGGAEPRFNMEDGEFHLESRNPYSGQLYKSPNHDTYNEMIQGEIQAGYVPTVDLYSGQMKSYKDKNKYALGGILQGAQIGMQALGVLDKLLMENDQPMPMDRNSFQMGGDIPLSSDAIKIDGKKGVDTNRRMINGKPYYFSKDEVIKDKGDSAFVYSDAIKDNDGKTFAEKAEKVAKSNGKIERRHSTSDLMAKAALRRNQDRLNMLAEKQEVVKQQKQRSNIGGAKIQVRYNDGGWIDDLIKSAQNSWREVGKSVSSGAVPIMDNITNPMTNIGSSLIEGANKSHQTMANILPSTVDNITNIGALSNQSAVAKVNKDRTIGSTPGDYIYMGGKGLELLSKGIMAAQPAQKISSRPFEIDPQRISATTARQANVRNYRSAVRNIDTGNASIDRLAKANLFGAKTQADTQAEVQAQAANRQAKLQTDQFNSQVRQRVEQANTQAMGAKQNMLNNVFTSVGETARAAQDMLNTRTTNRMLLQSLQGLSQYYKIDPAVLKNIMDNDPKQFNDMLIKYNRDNEAQ